MQAPRWLHDEREIMALLNAVLDRFDQQSATERTRPTWIAIEKHLSSLARMDGQADQLWQFVKELQSLSALTIKLARNNAYDAEWRGAKLGFNTQSEVILRDWLSRPTALPTMTQWRDAVQSHATLFANGIEPLLDRRIVIQGRSHFEIVQALATIGSISQPATLRQLSTYAFWGDSKILDDRHDLITALFPKLTVRERAIVVAIHLPVHIDGVLFIENQDTYTHAVAGQYPGTANLALVYLAGFKNTAERIREHSGACLHFCGELQNSNALTQWWFNRGSFSQSKTLPSYFWGDLDFSGMQMLKVLRERFDNVRTWQPGYMPMMTSVTRHGGKQLPKDSLQIDPQITGCDYADTVLLPAIREHGFWDQERLTKQDSNG